MPFHSSRYKVETFRLSVSSSVNIGERTSIALVVRHGPTTRSSFGPDGHAQRQVGGYPLKKSQLPSWLQPLSNLMVDEHLAYLRKL